MAEVKLLGFWPSPFSYRVIWAFKMKGIEYEYIEEDVLTNKSALLLQHNPVYNKIPVLLHDGKAIAESMVILEYIDETWPENHPLLPKDPYQKTVARFWAKFAEDKSLCFWLINFTSGEQQEKSIKATLEFLQAIEDYGIGEKKFFGGDVIGFVDLAFAPVAYWLGVIEELAGIKILEAHTFPRLHAWAENFKGDPVIQKNLPDRDEMLVYFKDRRESVLALPSPPDLFSLLKIKQ